MPKKTSEAANALDYCRIVAQEKLRKQGRTVRLNEINPNAVLTPDEFQRALQDFDEKQVQKGRPPLRVAEAPEELPAEFADAYRALYDLFRQMCIGCADQLGDEAFAGSPDLAQKFIHAMDMKDPALRMEARVTFRCGGADLTMQAFDVKGVFFEAAWRVGTEILH